LASCLQGILAQRLVPATGKKDQRLATELLIMSPSARKHIRDRQLHLLINVIQTGGRQGMHTMEDSLVELYQAGDITYDTAICNSYDPRSLRERIHNETLPKEE
jgi:twitching motility protein PilT